MLPLLGACSFDLTQILGSAEDVRGSVILGVATDEKDPRIVEVDETGEVTWEFHVQRLFGPAWDVYTDQWPSLMDVQPIEGGNILLSIYPLGLYEINRRGDIVWSLADPHASHDVDRLPDGNTLYTRTWAAQGEDAVVEVDPGGNVVWSWTGVETYAADPRFDGFTDEGGSWMHVNAVQRLEDGTTSLCIRNFNLVVKIDPAGRITREVSFLAPLRGKSPETGGAIQGNYPHAAEWLPEGGLLIALRSPDRALHLQGGMKLEQFWTPDVSGITDVDLLPDGGLVVASHHVVQQFDADRNLMWQWEDYTGAVPRRREAGADDTTSRGRAIFHTVTPVDNHGAPLDHD